MVCKNLARQRYAIVSTLYAAITEGQEDCDEDPSLMCSAQMTA